MKRWDIGLRWVPELDVSDIERSLAFYISVLGFSVLWSRPEERFAYLDFEGAQVMLQDAAGPGLRFRTAPLEQPYGRGINLQIEVSNVGALHDRVRGGGHDLIIPLEERWYRTGSILKGNRQFVVADPDGYLLRFTGDLGQRPIPSK